MYKNTVSQDSIHRILTEYKQRDTAAWFPAGSGLLCFFCSSMFILF